MFKWFELLRAVEMDDPYSHEAYLAWWRKHGGERNPRESYTQAHHAESHMRIAERSNIFLNKTPFEIFDFLTERYGPLLAAEAFRRALRHGREE